MPNAFNMETPQEIMNRIAASRDQMAATGNPMLVNQAVTGKLLDNLFGNPEVIRSQQIQKRVQAAQTSVPNGLSEVETEMYRLRAMRDALAEAGELDKASQVNMQLLQVANMKLEQDKLRQATEAAAAEEARKAGMYPLDLANKGADLASKLNDGQNYWRKTPTGGIERVNVESMNSLERRRLRKEGWVEGDGPSTEAEAGDALGLTKPSTNDLQAAVINGQNQLSQLASIAEKYDPKFLELPTQLLNMGAAALDKVGAGKALPVETRAQLERFTEFKRNSIDAFNTYIKSITGAAMAVAEAERIQKSFPDAEKDSPTQFVSKLRETAKSVLGVQKRAYQALQAGLTDVSGDRWMNIALPSVSDSEVDKWLQANYGIPPRSGGGRSTPAPAQVSDQDLINRYK